MPTDPIQAYLNSIKGSIQSGIATEHTYRAALEKLLESLLSGVDAINEPRRASCGAPDFQILRTGHNPFTIGFAEAKDVDKSLEEIEKDALRAHPATDNGKQLKRYFTLGNLLFTNYLEFRWYVDGERRALVTLAALSPAGKLRLDQLAPAALTDLLRAFLSQSPQLISKPKDLALRMARLTHFIRDIIIAAFESGTAKSGTGVSPVGGRGTGFQPVINSHGQDAHATSGPSQMLRDLRHAFAQSLIPDLENEDKVGDFADMFAQTLAYGLFAARCNHRGPAPFQRLGAAREIPKTNPFLRDLFDSVTGSRLDDEPFVGFVEALAQLLSHCDMAAILQDFGKRTRQEDPVIHFYETFLQAYDPKLKQKRGIYYTPEPVVSYIVRSVDYLLRTRLGCIKGLADTSRTEFNRPTDTGKKFEEVTEESPKVLILDPACGTGTFLYAVVDIIREKFVSSNDAGMWSGFVKKELLPRLFGFELLMAPYAVAHFKLGMQLAGQDLPDSQREKWTYDFSGDERLGIYLTNTLDEIRHLAESFLLMRSIVKEANSAAEIKRDKPVLAIMGNPPYANFGRMNTGEWITNLIKDWKPAGEKKWNPDDFMKFMRWAQWRISRTGSGILAFITNNTYIDGLTHRRMRESLMQTFDEIFILDLHGGSMKKETAQDGSPDKNVFDIQQGVAIGIFLKLSQSSNETSIYHADVLGLRDDKYDYLLNNDVSSTKWRKLEPTPKMFFFVPKKYDNAEEYESAISLNDIFIAHRSGVKTDRDKLFFDIDRNILEQRIKRFYSKSGLEPNFREQFDIENSSSYDLISRRERTSFNPNFFFKCLYRPFDWQWLYYNPTLTSRPAWDIMRHILVGENLGLVFMRQVSLQEPYCHFGISKTLVDNRAFFSNRGIMSLAPLYIYPTAGQKLIQRSQIVSDSQKAIRAAGGGVAEQDAISELIKRLYPEEHYSKWPNLNPIFIADLAKKLGISFIPGDTVGNLGYFNPEDIFHYIYAVFHSPTYRSRYAEFLKIDFPRVPLTSNLALFRTLCHKGAELVALHLLESPALQNLITQYPAPGDNLVEKGFPKYLAPSELAPVTGEPLTTGRVYISADRPGGKKGQYFAGVPKEVWEFQVGGYQVCEKWLKDRRGRNLSHADLIHYQQIVLALKETIRLMGEIDAAIPGWPIE